MIRKVKKIPTGIAGFDVLIGGGIIEDSVTLISGTPGTCKSILASQILYNNALKGRKCLYLDLEQKPGDLETQMSLFGWQISKVKNKFKIITVDSSDPNMLKFLLDEIGKDGYDLIVLDSLDSITSASSDSSSLAPVSMDKIIKGTTTLIDSETLGRIKLKKIFSAIVKSKSTVILTSEKVEGTPGVSRDTISEFLCDSIIIMNYLGVGSQDFRSLEIRKMRKTDHKKGTILFSISKKGIKIEKDPMKN